MTPCNSDIAAVMDGGKNAFGDTFRNYEDSVRQNTVVPTPLLSSLVRRLLTVNRRSVTV
jgi:hypothetical protein